MTVVLALAAALANAVVVVSQHLASTAAPPEAKGIRLAGYLVRSPMWLLGWVALIGAFVLQALALHVGQLSVVQPLLVTELAFALVLRRWWLRQAVRPAAWGAGALTCASLGAFLAMAEPRGGTATASSGAWVGAVVACLAAAAMLAAAGGTGSPGRRAALLGAAAAVVWALEATFIKSTTDTLAQYGLAGSLQRWPIYALALGGALGFVTEQAALHVGPLRSSQPMMVIVDPLASIALSVWLFDEHFTADPPVLVVAGVAFVAMCVGVVALTRTAPATMAPGEG